jgi:hypothetical protein
MVAVLSWLALLNGRIVMLAISGYSAYRILVSGHKYRSDNALRSAHVLDPPSHRRPDVWRGLRERSKLAKKEAPCDEQGAA